MARLKRARTPEKIQDYLNSIPINFEENLRDTAKSPLMVMRTGSAHCLEGAILGAYLLSLHGHRALLVHLETSRDWNHIIAPFKIGGRWGALSKTNHIALRYRDPVYLNIRELVMSYFHEYFTHDGRKTLRRYSRLLDIDLTFEQGWATEIGDLWGIDEELENIRHYDIAPRGALKNLRNADGLERKLGKIPEQKPPAQVEGEPITWYTE